MNQEAAFLQAIRDEPDEDVHRLAYADWLSEHGDAAQGDRGEFIRVQCRLARLEEADPDRGPLAGREKELLERHGRDWTDRTFAGWLKHPKAACRNPLGHDFCKLMGKGLQAQCDLEALPARDPRRRGLQKSVARYGRRMADDFNYEEATCAAGIFEGVTFRRGFIDEVVVQDWAFVLFAEAVFDLTLVRDLTIDDDCEAALPDDLVAALLRSPGLGRLRSLQILRDLETADAFAELLGCPHLAGLAELDLWLPEGEADEAMQAVAASPHLVSLRKLGLSGTAGVSESAVRALPDSTSLPGLVELTLDVPGLASSAEVRQQLEARFAQPAGRFRHHE